METPRVVTLVVELEQPISWKTGQCMRVSLPNDGPGRLFSVAGPGGASSELIFTMRVLEKGIVSSRVPQLKPGDTVFIEGPFGKFLFDDTDTHDIALIAGGSGISVLRAILKHVLEKKLPNKITLLFSVINKNEIIYKEELAALAKQYPQFTYHVTVTDDPEGWTGMCGRINRAMFEALFGDYRQMFYVCGPPPFIDCAEQILNDAGVPPERIKIDRWVF